jgi:hypothetical protein
MDKLNDGYLLLCIRSRCHSLQYIIHLFYYVSTILLDKPLFYIYMLLTPCHIEAR